MICACDDLLGILPQWLKEHTDRQGKGTMTDIRLRINAPPELVLPDCSLWLERVVRKEDIQFCINAASRYSPWAASTLAQGYITAPGGHRIGICGEAISQNGQVIGIREANSLCIRIARDFPGIADKIKQGKNILILGAPGWGKTTLLRDLIRKKSEKQTVSVADERGELFPSAFLRGKRMDVLTGAPKTHSIEQLIRAMGPEYLAVDEITAEKDCIALYHAACCGVKLMATAHAAGLEDFYARAIYKPLHKMQLFDTLIVLRPDRTFRIERVDK